MKEKPLISICIPAYKNIPFLERLINSIQEQTFSDYEVIISDDSGNHAIEVLLSAYPALPIKYIQNTPALGSPANWNNAIANANGYWIKIMHDDDWFTNKHSLALFAEAAEKTNADLIFCDFVNYNISTNVTQTYRISARNKQRIARSPFNLICNNVIGNPSCTLIRNNKRYTYNANYIWLVDIVYYIDILLQKKSFFHIPQALINVGISQEQITQTVFRNPVVEIPESIRMLNWMTPSKLKEIWIYDYYWRFIRNLKINSRDTLTKYTSLPIAPIFDTMIKQQAKIPASLMKNGVISKFTMFVTYLINIASKRM